MDEPRPLMQSELHCAHESPTRRAATTQVTLQFLMVLFMNVYLVDCSQAVPDDATPEEREILLVSVMPLVPIRATLRLPR